MSTISILISLVISMSCLAEGQVNKLSSVELQWEENKFATKYQVQVFNSKNKFLKTFESSTSLIKFKATSGKIKIRGRFLDIYGKYSEWSQFIEAEVPPEAVEFNNTTNLEGISPINGQVSNKTMKAQVDLAWKEAAQAKNYRVKIFDINKKLVKELMTTLPKTKIDLDAGEFNFSVTAIGNDQVEGKEVISPQSLMIKSAQISDLPFKIDTPNNDKNKFKIIFPRGENLAIAGKLEYSPHMVDNWNELEKITPQTDFWNPDQKLKPGKYRVTLWGQRVGWQDSAPFTYEFIIKPTEAEIKAIDPQTN